MSANGVTDPPPSIFANSLTTDAGWDNKSNLTKRWDTYPFIDPRLFKFALVGKVVVVTLAHRGIGRATALAFAAAGASVACVAPSAEALHPVLYEIGEKYNTPTLSVIDNTLEPDAPTRVVKLVEERLGPVDILINVIAPFYVRPFTQEPDVSTDWWLHLEQALRVPIAFIHAVLPSMIARRAGTIMSTTARPAGLNVPFLSVVGVSQAALLKFHHQLDIETRHKGIISFAVNPGLVASHVHDPDQVVVLNPAHLQHEPAVWNEMMENLDSVDWCATGLASGTFVALACHPAARCLSGLYVNAERDLGELIAEMHRDPHRIQREGLYALKIDEI